MSYAEDQATILAREQGAEYTAMEADLEDMAAANAGLLQELADAAAMKAGLVELGKTAAKNLAAADLAVRRNQGARDDDWADLCATRRAWAEVVRLVGLIDGSS